MAAPEGGELVWLSADPAGQNHARKVVRSKAAAWSHSNGDRRHNGRHAPPPPLHSHVQVQQHHPQHHLGHARGNSSDSHQDHHLLLSRTNNDPRLDPALQHHLPPDHYGQPPPHHQQPSATHDTHSDHHALQQRPPQLQYYHQPHELANGQPPVLQHHPASYKPRQSSAPDSARDDPATTLSHLQAESSHHSEMDEALNGRIASLEQAISGLQNDMRNIVSATEDIRSMLQERRQQQPAVSHQDRTTTDSSDFVALSSQVTAVGKKSYEVDVMKAQLETMRLRMKALEDEHSRNGAVAPSPPAYSRW